MGCFSSKNWESLIKTAKFQAWNDHFKILSLSLSDVKNLYKIFSRVDFDNSGDISLAELLAHINLDRTKFTERIFSIFDDDKSGQVDFHEFVLSLWNYCTLTKATLDMFAFDLYDQDSSGELSVTEIIEMATDIYGKTGLKTNFHAKNFIKELSDIEKRSGGASLRFEEFRVFTKNHPAMLFPAFQMQLALQQKVLGVRFWNYNANRRLQLAKGMYISIDKFLEMNTDAKDEMIEMNLLKNKISKVTTGKENHSLIKANETAKNIMQLTGTRAQRNWATATDKMKQKKTLDLDTEQTGSSTITTVKNSPSTGVPASDVPDYLLNGRELEMKASASSSGGSGIAKNHSTKSLWQRGLSAISLISHESLSSSQKLHNRSGSHRRQDNSNDVDDADDDDKNHHHHHSSMRSRTSSSGKSGVLTLEAVQSIQEVSPLQAWEKQPLSGDAKLRRREGTRVAKFHETFPTIDESAALSPRRPHTPPSLSPRRAHTPPSLSPRRAHTPPSLSPSRPISSSKRRNTAQVVPVMSAINSNSGASVSPVKDNSNGRLKGRRNTVLALG